jgi:hypothetical protein
VMVKQGEVKRRTISWLVPLRLPLTEPQSDVAAISGT